MNSLRRVLQEPPQPFHNEASWWAENGCTSLATPEQVRTALEQALRENPPVSLLCVAERLQHKDTSALYRAEPSLCRQVTKRSRGYSKGNHANHLCEFSDEQIVAILHSELDAENPKSIQRIAKELHYPNSGHLFWNTRNCVVKSSRNDSTG